jgi:hypothetical protein
MDAGIEHIGMVLLRPLTGTPAPEFRSTMGIKLKLQIKFTFITERQFHELIG